MSWDIFCRVIDNHGDLGVCWRLSVDLAQRGHYPAIDIEASISRVMHEITVPQHFEAARRLRELMSVYNQSRELVNLGAWKPGANPTLDRAVALWPKISALLAQRPLEKADLGGSIRSLNDLMQQASI